MSEKTNHPSGAPWRNFYGRIHGKTLRDRQKRLVEDVLPRLSPGPVSVDENPERRAVDLSGLFPGRQLWLEVGFGGGEHMAHMAQTHPEAGIIGCEPFLNGVAMALAKIEDEGLEKDIRIHAWDVRELFEVTAAEIFDKAFLLYPDPWSKARHHRRRFVTPEHLEPLHRALKPGAEFRVATDIPDYVRQTLEEVPKAGFEWLAEGPQDWRRPWSDWISTRYEQKALREGRVPHYLTFRRI